jgi:hypothetical protein
MSEDEDRDWREWCQTMQTHLHHIHELDSPAHRDTYDAERDDPCPNNPLAVTRRSLHQLPKATKQDSGSNPRTSPSETGLADGLRNQW